MSRSGRQSRLHRRFQWHGFGSTLRDCCIASMHDEGVGKMFTVAGESRRSRLHVCGARILAAALAVVWLLTVVAVVSSGRAFAARQRSADASLAGRIFTVAGALRWTGPDDHSRLATATLFQAGGGASGASSAIAVAADGGFLIVDPEADHVLRVSPNGRLSIAAGNGQDGFSGDGGPATSASLSGSGGVAALPDGGFLIADTDNDRVRRVWPDGHISTVAGSDNTPLGDGGPATSAWLSGPGGVAALPDGGFLIADTGNNRVRRVWPDGHISTVAGNGRFGFSGDGGPATSASLNFPEAVAALPDGGFLIADTENNRVRRVWPDGHISTVAGNGRDRLSGDGGPARSAAIGIVDSIATIRGGGFLISATTLDGSPVVRRVWPDGHISTVIGKATTDLPGDGGPASAAQLYGPPGSYSPASVAAFPDGGALIGYGNTVRLVVGSHGTRLLAAAIRALASAASRRTYRARVVLTQPAHLTIRVYRSLTGRPVTTARAFRPKGESSVTIRLGRRVTSGLYAIDLYAQRGSQATRAEQWVYLGGSMTTRSIRHIQNQIADDQLSNDPNADITVEKCHRFDSLRVDCAITGDTDYVDAVVLTPQGQLESRTYNPRRPLFKLHPRWNGPAIWLDLGAAWNPGLYGSY